MKKPLFRKAIITLAFIVCLAAWGGFVAAKLLSDSLAVVTAALTVAAFATEGLIWVLAIVGGWALFANRLTAWRKMRGGSAYYEGDYR
ncbi:hypothetical protein [Hyphococcus sp.]|uniref:hypothetical protein n=1 Tax=Hyphococcus sp. TaxID=2038636 RepID=UPI002082A8FD|nr:MAG: hypothetical protein DHS20C04_06060 [Marinicaulis sp.]